jgi:hypothetical protein
MKEYTRVVRVYGIPFKSHGVWSHLCKTETEAIVELRFKTRLGARRFHEKYKSPQSLNNGE